MLDFVVSQDEFGKPVHADLKLGLATAPVLYAAREFPELYQMMDQQFSEPGDVEKAKYLVYKSQGLALTRQLAQQLCQKAIDAISIFPDSPAQAALIQLTKTVLTRKK